MPRLAVLLQLILWTSCVRAFYPWFPAKICAEDADICLSDSTVSAGVSAGISADVSTGATKDARSVPAPADRLTFRLERKRRSAAQPSNNDEPLADRVVRYADRLAKKYAPSPTPPSTATSPDLAKRSNTFSIATAETPTVTNAVGINQDGTDFSYFVRASFGSEGKEMYMLMDTGAGTTWVMGSDCTSDACAIHSSFGPADSKTLDTTGSTFSISYGSGSVSGSLATDSVSVAGMTTNMTFGIANSTSRDFVHFPFDGILGLSMAQGNTDNFWQTVTNERLLSANVFGVSLWREEDGGDNTGELAFGAPDTAKYTGDITYTDVSSSVSGEWAIPMDNLGYDGKLAGVTGRLAYIDTGTTYMFGPPADVAKLHNQIPGATSADNITYTVPCTSNQPVTAVFSGVAFNISSKDWMSPASSSGGNCTSNIYGREVVSGAWLLGDLFIKNVYAIFDVDETRIGFALKSSSSAGGSSTSTTTAQATTTPGASGQSTATPAVASTSASARQVEGSKLVAVICVIAAVLWVA